MKISHSPESEFLTISVLVGRLGKELRLSTGSELAQTKVFAKAVAQQVASLEVETEIVVVQCRIGRPLRAMHRLSSMRMGVGALDLLVVLVVVRAAGPAPRRLQVTLGQVQEFLFWLNQPIVAESVASVKVFIEVGPLIQRTLILHQSPNRITRVLAKLRVARTQAMIQHQTQQVPHDHTLPCYTYKLHPSKPSSAIAPPPF